MAKSTRFVCLLLCALLLVGAPVLHLEAQGSKAFQFENLTFTIAFAGARAAGGFTPPVVTDEEGPLGRMPGGLRIQFSGDVTGTLYVFPIHDSRRFAPNNWRRVTTLQQILKRQTGLTNKDAQIGALPPVYAGMMLRARSSSLDFTNGSGIRYVTYYAQDTFPVSADSLIYEYGGLTSDNRFYLAARFNLRTDVLPKEIDQALMDKAYAQWDAYTKETTGLLNEAPPSAFTPSLEQLDALIATVAISAAAWPDQFGAVVCRRSPRTRLIKGMQGKVTPGDPNTMRSDPNGAKIGTIPGSAAFTVVGGPACSSKGLTYWQVKYRGQTGWTAEGEGQQYWLEPEWNW